MNDPIDSMKTIKRILGCVFASSLLASCANYDASLRRNQSVRSEGRVAYDEERRIMEERYLRLQSTQEDLRTEVERIRIDQDRVKNDTRDTMDESLEIMERRIRTLEQQLATLEKNREQDKQEIIQKLSVTIAEEIKRATRRPPPPTNPNRTPNVSGVVHTVDAGETLSAIAAAYKVSMNAIIRANNLTNPNALRQGQTLIIPDAP